MITFNEKERPSAITICQEMIKLSLFDEKSLETANITELIA